MTSVTTTAPPLETPRSEIESNLARLRLSFSANKTKSYEWRRHQLSQLKKMVMENQNEFQEVLKKDLNRSKFEALGMDVLSLIAEIDYALHELSKWMKPIPGDVPMTMYPATAEIHAEPFGVVLIIGAFNFPVVLTLSPLVGAIAAGNCAILKPSELSVHSQNLIRDLIPKYLDTSCFHVVCGAIQTTSDLLAQRWDKICFTGSVRVGKIVMKAAAENLTPVLLELGGKSPTIIDESVADLALVCRRVCWGKFANSGQICIAPDYVFCHASVYDKFVKTMKETIVSFYGENPEQSTDYCRLVTQAHAQRIAKLIAACKAEGNIAHGGTSNVEERFVSPTLVTDLSMSSAIMQEEIFGPVLPIFKYTHIDEIIPIINREDLRNPLVLYIFSKNRKINDRLIEEVPSGGVVVNDVLLHFQNHSLPFGGRGNSGMGFYHGKFSFEAFSHRRSVLRRDDHGVLDIPVRYPPYTDFGFNVFKLAMSLPSASSITWNQFCVGALVGVAAIATVATLLGVFV